MRVLMVKVMVSYTVVNTGLVLTPKSALKGQKLNVFV